jgi:hypothetical protein
MGHNYHDTPMEVHQYYKISYQFLLQYAENSFQRDIILDFYLPKIDFFSIDFRNSKCFFAY